MSLFNGILIAVLIVVIIAWIFIIRFVRKKLDALEGVKGVEEKPEDGSFTIEL